MTSLGSAAAGVGGLTLVSRVLGFVRDLVIARLFGADGGTDAFFVAFKVPNFMRRLFAEGAFSAAFVPVFHQHKAQRSDAELRRLLDEVTGTLGVMLLAVTALGVLGAPLLILAFAPGYAAQSGQQALAAEMLRLTLPYLLFIALTALAGAVLNANGRFGVPAFTPVLLNLAIIACALYLAPALDRPVTALAWGVLLGGILQLAFQVPFIARLGLLPRPRIGRRGGGVGRIFRRMGPTLFGAAITQINLVLDTLMASFLAAGSISWLYYSDRLVEFPLGVLGVALGTVILPQLSRTRARRSPQSFTRALDWALRLTLLLGTPAALGLVALAGPILATLFQSDQFTARDVQMASLSLTAYALGLTGFMAIKVLLPGYYARQDSRTPLRIAGIALGVNLVLNLALMGPFGHAGLALATTVAALLNAALLLGGLVRSGLLRLPSGWPLLLARTLSAGLAMWAFLRVGAGGADLWLAPESGSRLLRLSGWVVAGALVYALTLILLGLRPRHLRVHTDWNTPP